MKSFDLILARALGTPQKVERLSSPMLASNGILVLWASASTSPAEVLQDMELTDCIDYRLPEPTARDRRLLIYQKP
jgi:16S rRNA G527 N7-methylase RsmG